ncbi:MAG: SDR family oxidoreductase, partial [Hyphomonadaceae bacterium]
ALSTFTQALGRASTADNVRVLAIHPGPVDTERLKSLATQSADAVNYKAMPFGRAAAPEEIASAVAFLASPRSAYTSGTIISIDGGISAV